MTQSHGIRYFDYAATTPVDPQVVKFMSEILANEFGNPASRSHALGWSAEKLVETARQQVASLINANEKEIVWTSGATESNNLALKGAAHFYASKGKHIVTTQFEHKAVLDACRQLEREGFEVTYVTPDEQGMITVDAIEAALRDDTIMVSVMHANNEIGTIQPIQAISKLTRARKILLHVDAAQSCGKIPVDVEAMDCDLLSISAHKMYGPKGIGALFVRRKPRVRLEAQIHGGGHERGMRSGTLPTHQIAGFGEAARIAKERLATDMSHSKALRDQLLDGMKDIQATKINGDIEHMLPGHLNISFNYIEGESLIMGLKDLAISSGSACTSASLEPSYVLRSLGLTDELAHSSIRFSMGRFSTEADVQFALSKIHEVIERLRAMSPLWEMVQDGIDLSTIEWSAH